MSNKTIIIIVVVLIILAAVGYYLYQKNQKEKSALALLSPPNKFDNKTESEKDKFFNELSQLLPDNRGEFEIEWHKLSRTEKNEFNDYAKERANTRKEILVMLNILNKLVDHEITTAKEKEQALAILN